MEYKGYEIEIEKDGDAESPRSWDNLGKLICFHKRYSLGDKHDLKADSFNSWDDIKNHLLKELKAEIVLPLYLYDHSGISISTRNSYPYNDKWDAGQVGFTYVDKDTLLKEYNKKRMSKKLIDKATKILLAEVEIYNQYLTGDIFGYDILKDGEEIDNCWGCYGYDECLAMAKDVIDELVKKS